MIETWKESGIPLDAVHKGIERAFEKWHKRKRKTRMVNSLAYCAQEVLTAAREMEEPRPDAASRPQPEFDPAELAAYFRRNAEEIQAKAASGPARKTIRGNGGIDSRTRRGPPTVMS